MKIGLIMPISYGPLEKYIPGASKLPEPLEFVYGAQLAVRLREMGHEIHIFTVCRSKIEKSVHIHGDGMWLHITGGEFGGKLATVHRMLTGFALESSALRKMMDEYPCDIFNAHWCYEFARPVVESDYPHVVTMHDNPWRVLLYFRPKSYRFCRLLLSFYVLCRAKHVSAVSPYMASYCEKVHRMKNVKVIPNALSFHDDLQTINDRTTKDTDKIVFVEIANGFRGCKNIKRLLKAYKAVRDYAIANGREVELRIYGGEFGEGELGHLWAKKHSLADGVVWCGQLPHDDMLRAVSQVGDVFIHASLEESFGLVIIEAMRLGLPTIVGKYSGAASWVAGEGETGLVVDVRKVDAMRDAMVWMVEHPEERKQFSFAGIKRVENEFSLDTAAKRYEAMYKEVLASGK